MFESPLFAAALVGDVQSGGKLIQSLGKDGLAACGRGFPLLLHCAMMSGSWAMVSLLVDFSTSLAGASAVAAHAEGWSRCCVGSLLLSRWREHASHCLLQLACARHGAEARRGREILARVVQGLSCGERRWRRRQGWSPLRFPMPCCHPRPSMLPSLAARMREDAPEQGRGGCAFLVLLPRNRQAWGDGTVKALTRPACSLASVLHGALSVLPACLLLPPVSRRALASVNAD